MVSSKCPIVNLSCAKKFAIGYLLLLVSFEIIYIVDSQHNGHSP